LADALETGIDYLHPALGGGFGKGFKVIKGYDLVGDAYTGKNSPVPDDDPLDACGAASGASGMKIVKYRLFNIYDTNSCHYE
jgi:hypothetical protein